jgi:hypothetical protein
MLYYVQYVLVEPQIELRATQLSFTGMSGSNDNVRLRSSRTNPRGGHIWLLAILLMLIIGVVDPCFLALIG